MRAVDFEGVDIGLRLRLLPMVRLVPVSVMAREGRFSGVLIFAEDEEDRSFATAIVLYFPRSVAIIGILFDCTVSCLHAPAEFRKAR